MHDSDMTLAEFMEWQRLTDSQVAEVVGLDRSQISRLRRRQVSPSFETARRLHEFSKGVVTLPEMGAVDHHHAEPAE